MINRYDNHLAYTLPSAGIGKGTWSMNELLRMEHISKQFGDFYANRDINFDVRKGEVHTLLGENGAGKSTLMNVLIGLYQPTEGSIYLRGEKVHIDSPAQAVKHGIGMVHQHFMLIPVFTVLENLILGTEPVKGLSIDVARSERELSEISKKYGMDVNLRARIFRSACSSAWRSSSCSTAAPR